MNTSTKWQTRPRLGWIEGILAAAALAAPRPGEVWRGTLEGVDQPVNPPRSTQSTQCTQQGSDFERCRGCMYKP
jgi:hypothetical protein